MNIFKPKTIKKAKCLVWRMSATNPAGEFVRPSDRPTNSAGSAEVHERGFRASSMDLTDGSEVIETEMITLPDEFVDAFRKSGR